MESRESLVDLIFTKCGLVYGREFLSRWEGIDMADVKADWLHELGSLLDKPQAVRHALTHLPEKAPTVLTFRALCIAVPAYRASVLPAPKLSPERKAELGQKLRTLREKLTGVLA